ncbi:MAG: DMT family transporter [Alphaproteobacteria bacterium]|nr:DMT family transporter [Alphaproteobacteria bacterium]
MRSNFFRTHPYLFAAALMITSCASFSLMNVFIRLGSETIHTTMLVFLRNLITMIVFIPWVIKDNFKLVRTKRLSSHFWRATIGIVGMQSWFYCIATLPLTHATALSFTAPIFSTIFAVLFLKEKADTWRWLAMALGFSGVLIILRPAGDEFSLLSLIVLFTTSMWAIAGMLIKSLTDTESPLRIVFFMVLFMSIWSLPPALYYWQWPSLTVWFYLVIIACFAFVAQWSLAKAYSLADIVTLTPYDFSRLIFTSILAYIAFGESSDIYTWVGAAIIVTSALMNARRDAKSANDTIA